METMEMTTAAAEKPTVPKGWRWVRVNDVARMGSGHTPDKKKAHYYNGGIKWVSLQDSSQLDTSSLYETTIEISVEGLRNSSAVLHPANTVILLRDAGVGKSSIIREEMAVSQHFIAWQCGPDLLPEYLYYFLQYHKPHFEQQATGSTIKTLGLPFFQKLYLLLPPLSEQQQIVAVLDKLDETITSTQALLTAKRAYKRGLMQQLLTGQKRFPEFEGQPLPLVAIGEMIAESQEPIGVSNFHERITVRLNLNGVEARIVRGTETEEGTIYFRRRAGQFIYGKQNLYKGAIGIIPPELDGFASTSDMPAFDFASTVHPQWFLFMMSREDFYPMLEKIATGTGSKRIQPASLFKIKVPFPSLPEQQRIAAVLTACDQEIELLQAQLRQWQQQKKGLMQQLLTGQLRVPESL